MGVLALLPTALLFFFIGCFAWVGYQMFIYANDLTEKGKQHMAKNNMHFTPDGMKIGVKQMRQEDVEDKQQSALYNMWNHTSFPGYKSRIWNTTAKDSPQPGTPRSGTPTTPRPSTPRSASGQGVRQRT